MGFQLHFLIYYIAQHQEDDSQAHKNISIIFHIIARILFSICSTLVFPILDGISLGYLKGIKANEGDYGKEQTHRVNTSEVLLFVHNLYLH